MFKSHAKTIAAPQDAEKRAGTYRIIAGTLTVIGAGLFAFGFTQSGLQAFLLFGVVPVLVFGFGSAPFWYGAAVYQQRRDDLEAQALHDRLIAGKGSDEAGHILYLRSFDSTDQVKITVRSGIGQNATTTTYELESQLARAARKFSPFLALGQSLEHVGAAGRIVTSEDDWKRSADLLMRAAQLILIMPVTNPGTLWEIDKILSGGMVSKTVFINASADWFNWFDHEFDQKADWPHLQDKFAEHGYHLPKFRHSGRLIHFAQKGEPTLDKPLRFQSVGHLKGVMKSALKASGT